MSKDDSERDTRKYRERTPGSRRAKPLTITPTADIDDRLRKLADEQNATIAKITIGVISKGLAAMDRENERNALADRLERSIRAIEQVRTAFPPEGVWDASEHFTECQLEQILTATELHQNIHSRWSNTKASIFKPKAFCWLAHKIVREFFELAYSHGVPKEQIIETIVSGSDTGFYARQGSETLASTEEFKSYLERLTALGDPKRGLSAVSYSVPADFVRNRPFFDETDPEEARPYQELPFDELAALEKRFPSISIPWEITPDTEPQRSA